MNAPQNKPSRQGLTHIADASRYSYHGLRHAVQKETAFRLELALLPVLLPAGLWLGQDALQYALLFGSLLLVLLTELLNSALEAIADRVSTDHDPLIGQAKDMGSAAVLLAMLLVLLAWSCVAWQRFA